MYPGKYEGIILHMSQSTHRHTHTHTHTHTHKHIHKHTHLYIHVDIYTCPQSHSHTHAHIHTHKHTDTYIHTHWHNTHTHTNTESLYFCICGGGRTIGVGGLTECEEVDDGVVHLQHGGALPVHHGETGPPAHCVVGQTPGQDHEGLPAKYNTHTHA